MANGLSRSAALVCIALAWCAPSSVAAQAGSPFSDIEPEGEGSGAAPIPEPESDDPGDGGWGSGSIEDPENAGWGSGSIEDPENTGWGSGSIEDPENAGWGSGSIEDPGNTGWGSGSIEDSENTGWGSGSIEDPENASSPMTASPPAPVSVSGSAPRAIFSGAFESTAAVDTVRDDGFEDTLELLQELEMRVRYTISDRWKAVVEGRLSWFLTAGGDEDAPAWVPDSDSVQGRLAPELRDFYIAGRAGRWLFRFGNQSIVWGSTDISKPADQINPVDLRRGLSAEREDMRVPVPALQAVHVWDAVSWEFVVVPFFVPHRVAVYGGDTSPVRASGLTLPVLPGVDGLTIIDPSLEDLAQPLLLQTELPEERPRNLSAGTRLTLISGGWDVSAGYLYGWDRTPTVRLSPAARVVLDVVTGAGPAFFDGDPAELPEVQELIDSVSSGTRPFTATYNRMHMVEIDGVTYVGPVGVRFEAAFSPRRTNYLADLRAVRRPTLSSALGLSYESAEGDVIVTSEAFHLFAAPESDDGAYLYDMDSVFGVAGAVDLGLAAFDGVRGGFAEDLSLRLAVIYLPNGRDLVAAPMIAWDATDRLELSVGGSIFESFGDAATLGDLVDRNDSIFVSLSRVF